MGWRDRDWAKFSDDEWSAQLEGRPPRPVSSRRRRAGERVLTALVLVFLGAVAIAYGYAHIGLTSGTRLPVVPAKPSYTAGVVPMITVQAPPSGGVVSIRWRPVDRRPAAADGHICVSDSQQGQFCADFTAGELPAAVLTRHIQGLGLIVRSTG